MRIRITIIAALTVVVTVLGGTQPALSGTKHLQHLTLRYCQRFVNGFTAATPNVSCATAKSVVHHIAYGPQGCVKSEQCDVGRFVCVSYYSEFGFSKPFIDSHHGICVASHGRRIVFDLG